MNIISRLRQLLCDIWHAFFSEARTVARDEGVALFVMLVPLFYPILYSWIYNNEVVREVPVAVVDASHSSISLPMSVLLSFATASKRRGSW